jgi:protein-disulfide isomerase
MKNFTEKVINVVQRTKLKRADESQQRKIVVAVVSGVAVLLLIGVIAYLLLGSGSNIDYSKIHQERTADGAFILGNPEAAITVVAWEDFLCPHCQDYESTVEEFIRTYVVTGQARFEFRMLTAIDATYSALAFQLVECAEELRPGSFWTARETMFRLTSTSRFGQSSGREFAERMGLSYSSLLDCTGEANQYETDVDLAQTYGDNVSGTPAVGWRLNGSDVRFDIINRQPDVSAIGILLNFANQ